MHDENNLVRVLRQHLGDAALVVAALALSANAAFAVTQFGDYPADGRPALAALLHGDLHAFAQAHPAMGDLSLLVSAPFAALAYVGHPTELTIYRWGVLPCVVSAAALALWLARVARVRGMGFVGQATIVLLSVVNPLVSSAIELGHPEEILTSSLCIGALVAAFERRALLCTVLLGLALACKQWSLVTVLPILFVLERGRLRALAGALALAAAVTVPEVVGAPASYLRNQLSLASERGAEPSSWSWLWPLAPNTTGFVLTAGVRVPVTVHRLPVAVVHSLHSLIIGLDAIVAASVAWVRGLPLRRDDAFALTAIVLLLRCTLDTETMPYYHVPLFLDLLAWDAFAGKRLPLRALAGTALSWIVFVRFAPSPAVGVGPSSVLYGTSTAAVLILLLRTVGVPKPRRRGGWGHRRTAIRPSPPPIYTA